MSLSLALLCALIYLACRARVFQTLDGETRIYAMPFTPPCKKDPLGTTMWQLSFPATLEEATSLGALGGQALLNEALKRSG